MEQRSLGCRVSSHTSVMSLDVQLPSGSSESSWHRHFKHGASAVRAGPHDLSRYLLSAQLPRLHRLEKFAVDDLIGARPLRWPKPSQSVQHNLIPPCLGVKGREGLLVVHDADVPNVADAAG